MSDPEAARAELLRRYHRLPVVRQQLLQALSVHYEPIAVAQFVHLLAIARVRETPARLHTAQSIVHPLRELAAAGLAAPDAEECWRAAPALLEPAARHAVRDGLFERLARSVDDLRAAQPDADRSPAQALRLALYRRDADLLHEIAGRHADDLDRDAPGGFWNSVLDNPFDAAWLRPQPEPFQASVLRLWLNDANIHLRPAESALAYAREFARRDGPAAASVRPGIAILLLNRGAWRAAAAAIDAIDPADPRRAELHGWRFALLGLDAQARIRYEDALAAARRALGRRKVALQTIAGLFYPLVLLRMPDPARWREADLYLEIAERADSNPFHLGCRWLRECVRLRLGRRGADGRIEGYPPRLAAPSVLHWLHALARHWLQGDPPDPADPALLEGRRRAAGGGYRLWFEEYDALLRRLGESGDRAAHSAEDAEDAAHPLETSAPSSTAPTAPDNGQADPDADQARPRWIDAIPRRPPWAAALDALQALVDEDRNAAAADDDAKPRVARLVWQIAFAKDGPRLSALEQSAGKSGQWSKGRVIALRRLMQDCARMPSATDQDRAVAAAVRIQDSGRRDMPEWHFDLAKALPALAGHPLVFRGDAGGAALSVVRAEPELHVERLAEGGLRFDFLPPLAPPRADEAENSDCEADFADPDAASPRDGRPRLSPGTEESARAKARADKVWSVDGSARSGMIDDVAWELETPTRLRILPLDARARAVGEWIGAGLEIPPGARQRALAILAGLSARVRVQGEIDGAPVEAVEADARPWFHLLPTGETLQVELFACPLGADGPAFRPGRGGATVFAEREGRRVHARRDLARERSGAAAVLARCPSLASPGAGSNGENEWRLPDLATALTFLEELQAVGDEAVAAWPRGGRFTVRRARSAAELWLKIERERDWFAVDGRLEIDERLTLDMAKLLELRRRAVGRFLPLGDGEFVALADNLRKRLDELAACGEEADGRLRFDPLAALALERLEGDGVRLDADAAWRERLARCREASAFTAPVPPGLKAELRDYQVEGYRWLARMARWGAGACLADDMGLGKTVQALALLLHRAAQGPALVAAPMSVCFNWQQEAARFAPALRVLRFGDGDRDAALAGLRAYDLVVTSYGLLQQESERLAAVPWATAILDEAQAIKNMRTKRSQAAMALSAGFRLVTTGTPLENHLGELWTLFRFLNPGLLGPYARFQERFAGPVERDRDPEARARLRRLVRPFLLRRTKAQVLEELPPRTEIDRLVELGAEERAFYEALRREALERLDARPTSDARAEGSRRFRILAEIMKLRRACCNPELIAGAGAPPAAKMEAFLEILDDLSENNHQALVFSQFVDHLALIRRALDARRTKYQYLDGRTPARERERAVRAFQEGDGDVFLISLKAGGLGLNLTAADYVVHMDPWWNPAVEDQASDRAHRIGQTRPVTVYRLVARGTIEEKIVELHRSKRALAEDLLSGADDAGARIDVDALLHLLRGEDSRLGTWDLT